MSSYVVSLSTNTNEQSEMLSNKHIYTLLVQMSGPELADQLEGVAVLLRITGVLGGDVGEYSTFT